jgi:predicted amidophosphoribosyltransferase
MYSRGYDIFQGQDFTDLGEAVHKFKYWKLSAQDRDRIQEFCIRTLRKALEDKFGQNWPFNFIVAVPANRKDGHSLPPLLAKDLAGRSKGTLIEVGKLLIKQKELPTLKNLSTEEKSKALIDAYSFRSELPDPKKGILIIDDIYDSGTTLRYLARAIHCSYPDLPKFVVTLTALKGNYS